MKRIVILGIAWSIGIVASAQTPVAGLAPHLGDDVAAAAYCHLAAIDPTSATEQLKHLEAWPAGIDTGRVAASVGQMAALGVREIFALLRTSDLQYQGPTWIVTITDDADPQRVVEQLRALKSDLPAPQVWEVVDRLALGAASAQQLALLKQRRQVDQPLTPAAMDALAHLTSHQMGCVVWGDPDSRRVVREMFPALPVPFAEIDGRLLADRLRWGGVMLDLSPEIRFEFQLHAADVDAGKIFQKAANDGLDLLGQLPERLLPLSKEPLQQLIKTLRPQQKQNEVSVTLEREQASTILRELLAPPVRAAQQAAARSRRMNNFKQIALAMHNYHDQHKIFPSQANYDSQGRPMLSWRVHLLPWLDGQSIYDQFHLDEPWDSPHNRTLIEQMPDVYANPEADVQRVLGEGRTTVMLPIGAGTMFENGRGMSFRTIGDGTSRTVMCVDATPGRAVEWTKPSDWQVDWEHPLDGLVDVDRNVFVVVYADGSAHIVSADFDPQEFAKLLTANGGEPAP